VSVDVPVANAREEAGWAHIRVFGFPASADDIITNPDFEYFREIVLTNDLCNLTIYERTHKSFDLIHHSVPELQTFL
jgi:hypothetical protein